LTGGIKNSRNNFFSVNDRPESGMQRSKIAPDKGEDTLRNRTCINHGIGLKTPYNIIIEPYTLEECLENLIINLRVDIQTGNVD